MRVTRCQSHKMVELSYARCFSLQIMADTPDIVLTGGQKRKYTAAPDELRRYDDSRFANGSY